MSSMRVTLKDLAKRLNVSPSTVSRALHDNAEIGEATRIKIKKLAEELNYQPNSVASSLRNKKTFTIGVVVPEIVHYFFSSVISGIEDVAYDNSYRVILCQSNELYSHEVMNLKTLAQSQVDGILISYSKETKDFAHIEAMKEKGFPIVFYDRNYESVGIDSVIVDDFEGAKKATNHLIEIGCKKIIHLNGPLHMDIHLQRLNGYLKALEDHGMAIDKKLIIEADSFKSSYRALCKLIDEGIVFNGVFAVNDLTAVGAMKAIKSRGLKIPKDVAVIGFGDDSTLSEMVDPSLSSVMQHGFDVGKAATHLLLERIQGDHSGEPKQVILNTLLKIRESTKR